MRARILLLTLSLASAALLAGCAGDDPDESADEPANGSDAPMVNESSAMCLEGAEDCDDTPTMETVNDPTYIGT